MASSSHASGADHGPEIVARVAKRHEGCCEFGLG